MKRFIQFEIALVGLVILWLPFARAEDKDPTRVLDKIPDDIRLGKPKDLNGYFPMAVPASREAWEKRRKELREQVLVATGLWPMPEKTPLNPVIHGKIDRDEYTIEKVFFASYPGHYVSGNLYRPKGKSGKLPGVLCPHGHWENGRFFERNDKEAQAEIDKGAEKTMEGARYPLQARCAQLARMGCVVFHYDMVGYADSQQIEHRKGFTDAEAELRLQSFMGLQTWNSIRSLDFLTSLPEVDPKRIGVTGASGGGTQTFILCAVDDRPAVAFPAVMVSTAMQGGCVCENCSYLRQNTGNIELAGLFAPKPLGMSGANDWTIDIEKKGLPELKELYKLYGAEDRAMAKCFPQFDHNYNQVSRELMYNWFNKHLHLGQPEPVVETPFVPVPPKDLSVFDSEHPLPKEAVGAQGLRDYMTQSSQKQLWAISPQDVEPRDVEGLKKFRHVVGTALRVMIPVEVPSPPEELVQQGVQIIKYIHSPKGGGESIPTVILRGRGPDWRAVIWIHPEGKSSLFRDGKLIPLAQDILEKSSRIIAPDVFLTGEFRGAKPPGVNSTFAGFTYGYNRPVLANRVQDILSTVAAVTGPGRDVQWVDLVGFGKAGPWVVLARAFCGNKVRRTIVDANQFDFAQVQKTSDEMMLPGALKYGGLPSFAALCAPGALYLHNASNSADNFLIKKVYKAAGAKNGIQINNAKLSNEEVIGWLSR